MKKSLAQLASWSCRYWFGIIIVSLCICLRYLMNGSPVFNTTSITFLVTQFIGHIGFIIIFIGLLPTLIISLIFRNRILTTFVALVLSFICIMFLLVDTSTYALYHYHLNTALIGMIFSKEFNEIFDINWLEWLLLIAISIVILSLQVGWAIWLWRRTKTWLHYLGLLLVIGTISLSLFVSHLIHAYADAVSDNSVLVDSNILPYYYGLTAKGFAIKHHLITAESIYKRQRESVKIATGNQLDYPLHPLHYAPNHKPSLNVLVIGIDTLRFDAMTAKITPYIYQYAQHAVQFLHHTSGGNCTQPGIFSLFYGIPSTYWTVTKDNTIAPVLMRTFQKIPLSHGYFWKCQSHETPFLS